MPTKEDIQKEVYNNYKFYLKDKIPNYSLDKYVLIKKEEFIEYFDSIGDALNKNKIWRRTLFCSKVNDLPVDLGLIGNILKCLKLRFLL